MYGSPQPRGPTSLGAPGPVVSHNLTLVIEVGELAKQAVELRDTKVVLHNLLVLIHFSLFGRAREHLDGRRAWAWRTRTRADEDTFKSRVRAPDVPIVVAREGGISRETVWYIFQVGTVV